MKKLIKPAVIIILTNATTYLAYIILLLSGIIHFYETECEGGENLHIYIFYFIFSLVTEFAVTILLSPDKKEILILSAGIILTDIISLNCFGTEEIIRHTTQCSDRFIKNLLPYALSSTFLICVAAAGYLVKNKSRKTNLGVPRFVY